MSDESQENVRRFGAFAFTFGEAMGQDHDVTITQAYGPEITGRPVKRLKAPVASDAGLSLVVRLPEGGERAIHLAEVRGIRRAGT